jgi:hypothetical protein
MQMIGLLTKGIDNWGHVSIALFLMFISYYLPTNYFPFDVENFSWEACLVELPHLGLLDLHGSMAPSRMMVEEFS